MDRLRMQVLPVRRARAQEEEARNTEVQEQNPNARVNWHHRNFLNRWWQLAYRREDMLEAIAQLPRYIALSIVGKLSKTVFGVYRRSRRIVEQRSSNQRR